MQGRPCSILFAMSTAVDIFFYRNCVRVWSFYGGTSEKVDDQWFYYVVSHQRRRRRRHPVLISITVNCQGRTIVIMLKINRRQSVKNKWC